MDKETLKKYWPFAVLVIIGGLLAFTGKGKRIWEKIKVWFQ